MGYPGVYRARQFLNLNFAGDYLGFVDELRVPVSPRISYVNMPQEGWV